MADENKDELNKKVDEAWKESVLKDKTEGATDELAGLPEITFNLFLSGLLMEALIALGDVEHPVTKKKELSPAHAKFIIETLAMLKEKTKNNLTKEEESSLESILYDLRMRFVQKSGK